MRRFADAAAEKAAASLEGLSFTRSATSLLCDHHAAPAPESLLWLRALRAMGMWHLAMHAAKALRPVRTALALENL